MSSSRIPPKIPPLRPQRNSTTTPKSPRGATTTPKSPRGADKRSLEPTLNKPPHTNFRILQDEGIREFNSLSEQGPFKSNPVDTEYELSERLNNISRLGNVYEGFRFIAHFKQIPKSAVKPLADGTEDLCELPYASVGLQKNHALVKQNNKTVKRPLVVDQNIGNWQIQENTLIFKGKSGLRDDPNLFTNIPLKKVQLESGESVLVIKDDWDVFRCAATYQRGGNRSTIDEDALDERFGKHEQQHKEKIAKKKEEAGPSGVGGPTNPKKPFHARGVGPGGSTDPGKAPAKKTGGPSGSKGRAGTGPSGGVKPGGGTGPGMSSTGMFAVKKKLKGEKHDTPSVSSLSSVTLGSTAVGESPRITPTPDPTPAPIPPVTTIRLNLSVRAAPKPDKPSPKQPERSTTNLPGYPQPELPSHVGTDLKLPEAAVSLSGGGWAAWTGASGATAGLYLAITPVLGPAGIYAGASISNTCGKTIRDETIRKEFLYHQFHVNDQNLNPENHIHFTWVDQETKQTREILYSEIQNTLKNQPPKGLLGSFGDNTLQTFWQNNKNDLTEVIHEVFKLGENDKVEVKSNWVREGLRRPWSAPGAVGLVGAITAITFGAPLVAAGAGALAGGSLLTAALNPPKEQDKPEINDAEMQNISNNCEFLGACGGAIGGAAMTAQVWLAGAAFGITFGAPVAVGTGLVATGALIGYLATKHHASSHLHPTPNTVIKELIG